MKAQKKITIHYSVSSSGSTHWQKTYAQYLMQGKNGYEIWKFNGKAQSYKGGMGSFAIQYEVGGKEYWDNNLNRNYHIKPAYAFV